MITGRSRQSSCSGLIAGCFMTSKGSRMPGMADVLALFDKTIPCENAYGVEPELYGMFQRLEKASPGCFAVREFNSWRSFCQNARHPACGILWRVL